MWHLTACQISISLLCLNWIKNERIFYRISELMLAILIQRYDKNHFISRMRDLLKFYRMSGATFYKCINTIYQFIKPFLDNKMSIFFRNMESLNARLNKRLNYIARFWISTIVPKCQPYFNWRPTSTKVREKPRECHNHKPQPFPYIKSKRKPKLTLATTSGRSYDFFFFFFFFFFFTTGCCACADKQP